MSHIYVLDWLINKPIKLKIKDDQKVDFIYGEKVLYRYEDSKSDLVGLYLGYGCDSMKEGTFIKRFGEKDTQRFDELQQKAAKLFDIFKQEFKKNFAESVPVTARFDMIGNLIYFYFYAETRFDFSSFIRELRPKIGCNFFFFQIGARDRVRMAPGAEKMYGTCGQQLCCKLTTCPLPTVDSENIGHQGLENRSLEKVKGRCGKLKCCLNYEKDIYDQETAKMPKKGEEFEYNNKRYRCNSVNIMSGEIVARNIKEDEFIRIKKEDLSKKQ